MPASDHRREWFSPTWFFVLSIVAIAIYRHGLQGWYYADDFELVFDDPASKIFYYFTHPNPDLRFYRPLQAMTMAIFQSLAGLDTLPNHLFQLALHVLLCWLIFRWMERLGCSRLQSSIASAFMLISPANALAVASNDTSAQLMGTLFGCVSLWCLFRAYVADPSDIATASAEPSHRFTLLALFFFTLSLFSKESSVSFLFSLGVVTLLIQWRRSTLLVAAGRSMVEMLPFVLVTLIYLLIRHDLTTITTEFGSGKYNFHLGMNIPMNIAQLGFVAFLPMSSVDVFVAMQERDLLMMATAAMATVAIIAVVAYGAWRSRRVRMVSMLMLFALVAMCPMVLLNHVNENYVYNPMPFIAAIVGIGAGTVVERLARRRAVPGALAVFIVAFVASHVVAVDSKTALMTANGERARRLLSQILRHIADVPPNGQLLLNNPPLQIIEYSSFTMWGYSVFEYGENIFNVLSHRHDFKALVIPLEESVAMYAGPSAVVLELHADSVIRENMRRGGSDPSLLVDAKQQVGSGEREWLASGIRSYSRPGR